ncbi:MAG: YdcF family protein [Leptolyngbyaceae cyanobacterium SM2_5_2]|nr:YdcF family protein [Leptolyngbyaceae cyanobacterium SM2_5_2]
MRRVGLWILLGLALAWCMNLWLSLTLAARQAPVPEGMLVLGGDPSREVAGAEIARHYPDIPIWVSSGESPDRTHEIFEAVGIAKDRLYLDYSASDTVTNFTTLVPEFKRRQLRHLYVVTSDFHMARARAIGTVVLGSQGIVFTPVAITSDRPPEPATKILRDLGRSLLWLATGRTGSSFRSERAS